MPAGVAKVRVEPKIETVLNDSTTYFVSPQVLNVLLENKRVMKFRRSSGWAVVGEDPIRIKPKTAECHVHFGPERRLNPKSQLIS
ncbi:MAG: hypothetical protein JRF07_03865 [Deltaproteobacteria bacterium]|jgi:hypothetical protein|nr:hypothetical protein [Deltaproteobacteria bacterium]MBW2475953.1 hypothetical protein [Deltaproteobacteria bacterium]MBW2519122.1 hypothetical protein [Deltaproteobacteria bacterium]